MITMEDMWKERKKHEEKDKEFRRELNRMRIKELRDQGLEPLFDEDGNSTTPPPKQTWDHPSTMENSTATILWIVAMVVSLLFKGGWALCVLETIVWWKHITRHK